MGEEINVRRMTQIDFCIVVYWMHGLTVGEIHKRFGGRVGKTPGAIRGITTRLTRSRSDMTKADRQKFLDHMKAARIDDGMMPAAFFVAKSVTTDKKPTTAVSKPAPAVPDELAKGLDMSTKTGRKEYRRRKEALKKKDAKKATDSRKVMEAGAALRGQDTHAFEYLCNKGLLADPADFIKGALKRDDTASLRQSWGRWLITVMELQYGSGIKSQSFEGGGGSSGAPRVAMSARMAENTDSINCLRSMMGDDIFRLMERLIINGEFVWRVPSKKARDLCLENIRMALDCVTLLNFQISQTAFQARWNFIPKYKDRDPEDVRRSSRKANDIIKKAQRSVR